MYKLIIFYSVFYSIDIIDDFIKRDRFLLIVQQQFDTRVHAIAVSTSVNNCFIYHDCFTIFCKIRVTQTLGGFDGSHLVFHRFEATSDASLPCRVK